MTFPFLMYGRKAVAAAAVDPPVANITFNAVDAAAGTFTMFGNASSGGTGALSYTWSITGPNASALVTGMNFDATAESGETWTGANPGASGDEDPGSIPIDCGNPSAPLGGYTVDLEVEDEAAATGNESLYALATGSGTSGEGSTTALTMSYSQGAAITGNVTVGVTGVDGDTINVADVTVPTNATVSVLVLTSGGAMVQVQSVTAGPASFSGVAAGTYSLVGYGAAVGRNGPVVSLATDLVVE